ncbi:MAG: hypothetical protein Q7T85_13210 [Nitrosomonas sp.]|nr:hypothetical protein [Nitrosomonas sp.]
MGSVSYGLIKLHAVMGLDLVGIVPAAKTIREFREELKKNHLIVGEKRILWAPTA